MKKLFILLAIIIAVSCTKQDIAPKKKVPCEGCTHQKIAAATGTILKYCIVQNVTHKVKFKAKNVAGNYVQIGVYEMDGTAILVKPVTQDGKQTFLFTFSEGQRCDVQYILTGNGIVLSQANATCIICGN